MKTDTKAVLRNLKQSLDDAINTITLNEPPDDVQFNFMKKIMAQLTSLIAHRLLEDARNQATEARNVRRA